VFVLISFLLQFSFILKKSKVQITLAILQQYLFFQFSFYFKVQSKKYKQRINKKLCRCVVVVAAVFFYKGGCCVSNSIKTADFVLFSKYLFRLKILCQKKKKKIYGHNL